MRAIQPTRLEIFITNRCNLCCTYCSSRYLTAKEARTLSFEELKRAVDLFAGYGGARPETQPDSPSARTICFTGGEPLLEFPLLKRIISYVRTRREWFAMTVNTNGTLLTREAADFLLENDVYLAVSLDGAKRQHDTHRIFKADRRASVYDALVKNLRALPRQYLANVRASVTITSRTLPSLVATVGLLQDMGFRFVELGLDSYELWTPEKLKVLEKTLTAVRRHYIAFLNSGEFKKMRRVFSFSLENKQLKAGFYTPMNDVSLSPDGVFYPSDTLATAAAGGDEFVIGTLAKGIDFSKMRRIYSRASASIPADKRAEGTFSPVDRYLYCRAHGKNPGEMLADAAAANRIFMEKIGGLLEVQRVCLELAKNPEFGDIEHGPKYSNGKEVRAMSLGVSPESRGPGRRGAAQLDREERALLARLRATSDYFLYSGGGVKSLTLRADNSAGSFGAAEAVYVYAAMKASLLGKKTRFSLERDAP